MDERGHGLQVSRGSGGGAVVLVFLVVWGEQGLNLRRCQAGIGEETSNDYSGGCTLSNGLETTGRVVVMRADLFLHPDVLLLSTRPAGGWYPI